MSNTKQKPVKDTATAPFEGGPWQIARQWVDIGSKRHAKVLLRLKVGDAVFSPPRHAEDALIAICKPDVAAAGKRAQDYADTLYATLTGGKPADRRATLKSEPEVATLEDLAAEAAEVSGKPAPKSLTRNNKPAPRA